MTNLNYSAVFIDASVNLFNGAENLKDYDVLVYHPRTTWREGRPNWIFNFNRKVRYINNEVTTEFPCLVLAYLSKETISEKGNYKILIPYDIIELKNKQDKKALSLKSGDYDLLIKDAKGHEQKLKINVE